MSSLFRFFAEHGGTQDAANPLIALPTGSGKSMIIGEFGKRALTQYPSTRILMLCHVKEIIEQNAKAIMKAWPQAPLGVYSAGLKQRDTAQAIIYGGIASVYKKLDRFGWRDLLLIDEAHLLAPDNDGMYLQTIEHFRKINPYFRVCGFTATKFRRGQGLLTDSGLFTSISYDLTDIHGFNRLIREGYLCTLIPKRTDLALDVSDVGLVGGEYNQGQLERAVDVDRITMAACLEACKWGSDRRSWLAFCSGIDHAEHTATALQGLGVNAAAVHSKLSGAERDKRIAAFKRGEIRCLTNNNVLTTGFDHPPIDLILMLRPTVSPVLWVQMCGRGTRPADGKENCLVLDYARNTERLGPINDPVIPRKKGKGTGEVPIKICDACGNYNHILARVCAYCGEPFEFATKIVKHASDKPLIKEEWPILEWLNVHRVMYSIHRKPGMPESIKATYFCDSDPEIVNEFVCLEHAGFAGAKARAWWRQRHAGDPPQTSREAIKLQAQLRMPKRINVHVNKTYPEITGVEF